MRGSLLDSTSLVVVIATALVACGTTAPPPAASPTPPPPVAVVSEAATPVPAPALTPDVPDTPAGHQLAWVLASIAHAPSEGEVAPHFTPTFLEHVPAAKVAELFGRVATAAPFTLEKVSGGNGSKLGELTAVVRSAAGPRTRIKLAVEAAPTGRMQMLLLRPVVDNGPPATSWDDVEKNLRAVAPSVAFLAAEVGAGACTPIASIDPDKPLALGSAFKLYVLDALASQVAAGKHRWDETLAVDDARKSLPSGPMRDEPAGKTFSVREFADRMISVSDNTAADHLLAFVGEGAVEDVVKASGHASPSLLEPFLSTREMFALKLLASPEERAAYVSADLARKRALLAEYDRRDLGPAMAKATSFTKPVMIDSIEWFASPSDLCKVMVDLRARSQVTATAPVASILSINPGLSDGKKQYSYIGFKGGSEPGVLNVTWLLQRARDAKWVFLTVGWNNPKDDIDELAAIEAASKAREFLGR